MFDLKEGCNYGIGRGQAQIEVAILICVISSIFPFEGILTHFNE